MGFVWLGLLPLIHDSNDNFPVLSEFTEEQQAKIGQSIGFIYRHTKGYKEVCQKEGYEMNLLPNDFLNYFSKDIEEFNNELQKYNYSIDVLEDKLIQGDLKKHIMALMYSELENFGKLMIMSYVSEQQGIPIEDIKWESAWDNLLAIKDICQILDEKGLEMLKEDENNNVLKANKL